MRNFKHGLFIRAVLFLAVFVLIAQVLGFALTPAHTFTRLMMHDFYSQDGTIEFAFIGASHAMYGLATGVLDETLGGNSFNLGSQSQKAVDSYYLLRELLRENKPKLVAIELTYAMYTKFQGYDNPTGSMLLFDYYRWSGNKLNYLADVFSLEDYANLFLSCYRYRANVPNVLDNLKTKLSGAYFSYDPSYCVFGSEGYESKGFVNHQGGFVQGNMGRVTPYKWDRENLNTDELAYLAKMIQLCKENGVQVILFSTPLPIATLLTLGCYDDVHAFFADFSDQNDVPYLDFNLVKESCYARSDSDYFDTNHLNGDGAAGFSAALGEVLSLWQSGTDISACFYEDFQSLKVDYHGVANVYLQTSWQGQRATLAAKAYCGDDATIEYRFLMRREGESEYTTLQDFSTSASVQVSVEEGERVQIRVEAKTGTDAIAYDTVWIEGAQP